MSKGLKETLKTNLKIKPELTKELSKFGVTVTETNDEVDSENFLSQVSNTIRGIEHNKTMMCELYSYIFMLIGREYYKELMSL